MNTATIPKSPKTNIRTCEIQQETALAWIKEAKLASWWLTWEDLEWPDTQIEEKWIVRAKSFQQIGINTAVIYGFHFRWDYLVIMQRVKEIIRRVAEICHDQGIRLVEHHSATLMHHVRNAEDRWQIREHNRHHVPFYTDNLNHLSYKGIKPADWQQISGLTNKPVYYERYNSVSFCPNNPDFQQAYLDLVLETVAYTNVDAVMSDDLHFLPDTYSCTCQFCRERFTQHTAHELPPATDTSFWENRENPLFQSWLQLRYQWNAEHYQRLRNALPENVAIWGCASHCTHPNLTNLGFAVELWAPYLDAVFMELTYNLDPLKQVDEIIPNIAAFASLARQENKPLIALTYPSSQTQVKPWLDIIRKFDARPWISRQIRCEKPVTEEELLAKGFTYPKSKASNKPRAGVRFSRSLRDRLPQNQAHEYSLQYQEVCNRLNSEGFGIEVLFDGSSAPTPKNALSKIMQYKNGRFIQIASQKSI